MVNDYERKWWKAGLFSQPALYPKGLTGVGVECNVRPNHVGCGHMNIRQTQTFGFGVSLKIIGKSAFEPATEKKRSDQT